MFGLSLHAQLFERYEFSEFGGQPSAVIPDGLASGLSDTRSIAGSSISLIGSLSVSVDISGEFNGDLYGYLQHGSGFAVFLNGVGRTATDPAGYDDQGFAVTFSDSALQGDIHLYRESPAFVSGSPLTGVWQPDGRKVDPAVVVEGDPRTAMLSSFVNLSVDGQWTLFLADTSSGGVHTLNGWSLEITAVPEPEWWLGLSSCGLLAWGAFRKLRSRI